MAGGAQGAMELGTAVGQPRLGEDINALMQVAPMAGAKMPAMPWDRPPGVNPLAAPPKFMVEHTAPPRPPGMTDAERIMQLLRHDDTETAAGPRQPPLTPSETPPSTGGPTVTAPPIEGAGMLNPEMPAGPAGARSGGAAATTEPIPEQTKAEIATNIRKDVGQTALERAGGEGILRDDNAYVGGIPPRPEAFRDFNAQTALDHKYFYGHGGSTEYRSGIDAINDERHAGMTAIIKSEMGDGNTLKALQDNRREVTPDKMGVFTDEKPVDPKLLDGVHALVDQLIERNAKDDGVRNILENVKEKLLDAEGNREVLPSQLQKVRDMMTRKLEQTGGSDTAAHNARQARSALTETVEALNPVMNSGAPKWDLWRQEWAKRSKLIDQQDFLQDYDVGRSKSLWDEKGKLQFRKVQQLLADVANNYDKPTHPAQSLTDATIQKIVAVRNEVGAEHLAEVQGRVPGSPTKQLRERAAKEGGSSMMELGRLAATGIAHGVGGYAAQHGIPGVNAAVGMYSATRPFRQMRKAAKTAAQLEAESNALKQRLLSQPEPNPLNQY